ncbi:DUF2567 domain-containing protein [Streptomyces zingiberis]|uniref:DUF2567 domain-containing protein n=1 Tax=Streptomyces zingiberis TaxID=2053010 RepID=A0ABX1BZ83_9ACTN|nr:DUF2567 domain-containing protein [Streptomyces zingiberis]NJQ02423.1 DUF2567 domain-containing protein [Streptomyces zingiberis]
MTAPLTPQPHGRPPHDTASGPPGAATSGREAGELRRGVLTGLSVTVSGVLLGLAWLWLAPRVPLVSDGEAVYLENTEGEQAIAADGTFVLLGLAFGAVTALVVFLLRRSGGVGPVVGLALGGLLGSVLAWRLGVALGPTSDVVAHAREVGKGVPFDGPLELRAKGALLAWPIAAMLVHLALTGLFGPRDPEPQPLPPL